MMSFHGFEITSFMKGRLTMSRWSWFLVYDFEASRSPIEAHIIWIKPYHLNHIISYHIISYHIISHHIISQNSSHLVTWHRTQKHPPKPNLRKLPWNLKPTCRCKPKCGWQNCHDIPPAKAEKKTPKSGFDTQKVDSKRFLWILRFFRRRCPTVKGVQEPMEKEKS